MESHFHHMPCDCDNADCEGPGYAGTISDGLFTLLIGGFTGVIVGAVLTYWSLVG